MHCGDGLFTNGSRKASKGCKAAKGLYAGKDFIASQWKGEKQCMMMANNSLLFSHYLFYAVRDKRLVE
jgi:hypothetical protein